MSTTKTIYPNSFGPLVNLEPIGFLESDIPEGLVIDDNGVPLKTPEQFFKQEPWQQKFFYLLDVENPAPDSWGKTLRLTLNPDGVTNIVYRWPSELEDPRNFSIIGDGTAPEVSFNGTNDVQLTLRNLVAEKWKTPRTLSINGNASGSVVQDGGANTNIALTVNQAAHANEADHALNADHALTADAATQAGRLTTPRNFSITGDGTAPAVSFNGTANVQLDITIVQKPTDVGPGWVRLPGGTIIQYGNYLSTPQSQVEFAFPIPFTTAVYSVVVSLGSDILGELSDGLGPLGAQNNGLAHFLVSDASNPDLPGGSGQHGFYMQAIGR